MNSRRLTALAALGIVGAGVVGLILTSPDGDEPTPVAEPASEPAAPEPEPEPEPKNVSGSGTDEAASAPGAEAATPAAEQEPASEPTTAAIPLVPDLPDRGPHPPLRGIDGWLQSDVTSLDELRGKVLAVQFWTFGCSNCTATIPHMQALYEKYGGDDFEIVGVHAPEFDFERDVDAIAEAADRLGVSWPIALDTEKQSFRSWQTERRFWPRLYLIDQEGNVRYDKIGEGKYDVIDAAVGALIDEGRSEAGDDFVERDVDENSDAM